MCKRIDDSVKNLDGRLGMLSNKQILGSSLEF